MARAEDEPHNPNHVMLLPSSSKEVSLVFSLEHSYSLLGTSQTSELIDPQTWRHHIWNMLKVLQEEALALLEYQEPGESSLHLLSDFVPVSF